MSTSTTEQVTRITSRVLDEGYGPGAWHGPDLKAALADVTSDLAFWRPAKGRHNIAEIALHHAYSVRAVRAQISGAAPEPFVLEGEDWFDLPGQTVLGWAEVQAAVAAQQRALTRLVDDVDAGRTRSPMADAERFGLVLGITCHAVYHAGQIQLLKKLHSSD